jgi:hypothetical protein
MANTRGYRQRHHLPHLRAVDWQRVNPALTLYFLLLTWCLFNGNRYNPICAVVMLSLPFTQTVNLTIGNAHAHLSRSCQGNRSYKSAIFKAIKNGRISASKDDKGQWMIDPAELFRVYAPAEKKETEEPQTENLRLLLKLRS